LTNNTPAYLLICAFNVSSTTRSKDDAFGGALSRCSATNLSRFATSAVEFVHALLGLQRAQIVRQFVVLDGGKLLTPGRDVADQIAMAGDRLRRHPCALVQIARHFAGL